MYTFTTTYYGKPKWQDCARHSAALRHATAQLSPTQCFTFPPLKDGSLMVNNFLSLTTACQGRYCSVGGKANGKVDCCCRLP